jgi:hypothetical protein
MKGGKKEVGVMVVVAIMVVLQLMAAPTAMARVLDGYLATTPKITMLSATLCYTGETCKYTNCFTPACYCNHADGLCYVWFSTPAA